MKPLHDATAMPVAARPQPEVGGDPVIVQAREPRSRRIEALRAIAALGVAGYHISFLRTTPIAAPVKLVALIGNGGLYVFFALSGYLIFRPFARRDLGGGGRIDVRRYLVNRAVRILPLYYVVITFLLLVQEHGGTTGQWVRFYLFAENFSHQTVHTVDVPAWSLVVELHFYVLLPLLALAVARTSRGSAPRAAAVLLVLAAASLALRVESAYVHPSLWQWSLPANLVFFIVGMLLAVLDTRWRARTASPPRFVPRSSATWLVLAAVSWPVVYWFHTYEVGMLLGAFFTVGAVTLPLRSSAPLRCLDWRPLATLGIASYSLYLWHQPIVRALGSHGLVDRGFLVDCVVILPVCVAVALLSYAAVEAPFLRLRQRWERPSPAASRDGATPEPGDTELPGRRIAVRPSEA